MKRICFLFTITAVMALGFGSAHSATEITLDEVTGLVGGDTVQGGQSVKFTFRLTYTPGNGSAIAGFTNGFRVWMANDGERSPITYDSLSIGWLSRFDQGFFFSPRSIDGIGADTIGFGAVRMVGPGIADGFDQPVWWVETTPYQDNDTLCIDSSFYPPSGSWLWAIVPGPSVVPAWGGPYCFHVKSLSEVYFADETVESSQGVVTIGLQNDRSLWGFVIPLVFTEISTFATLDSVKWIGRMASPSVLENRFINMTLVDGPPSDQLLLAALTNSTNYLPPGDGEIAALFFSTDSIGLVLADTLLFPPANTLVFVDDDLNSYVPDFFQTELVCLEEDLTFREADILFPEDSTPFYGDSAVILGDFYPAYGDTLPDGHPIEPDSAAFAYSYDNVVYTPIGTDISGADDCGATQDSFDCEGDGWSVTLDVTTLTEGWGYLSMIMYFSDSIIGEITLGDTIPVYIFPEPPEVEILSPEFESGLSDSAGFSIKVKKIRPGRKVAVKAQAQLDYVKGVPNLNQNNYCGRLGPVSCGPTAVASCLKYWSLNGFPNIMKNKKGKELSDKELVKELKIKMKTRRPHGTYKSDLIKGTISYLKAHCQSGKFKFKDLGKNRRNRRSPEFKDLKKELEKNKEDVVALLRNDPDGQGHYVTFNSLSNKANPDGSHNVDFMDPWRGQVYNTTWRDVPGNRNDSRVRYGFGAAQANWEVRNLFVISPKEDPKAKGSIDTLFDSYTDDTLFNLVFDISDQAPDTIYFFTFTAIDSISSFEFDDYTTYYRLPCCVGIRGDENMDEALNVADVTYLTAYLKQKPPGSPAPPCFEEGDVNGSGTINVSDLTYLVAYLKQSPPGSPPPPACP
jgi:hypothetical protein